ncbi:MAG: D-cysteine desulfhydrase family protein [Oscillospiraceae bacterium]|nr:D-cysteine desulfhydrase family protein [Oscillospiraceae bacterium]
MAFDVKKLSLVEPTPLQYLPTLSRELGIELYCKRDDLTALGAGGNKLRKLEYLAADALDKGATMLLTVGGAQTNHGRLTAAVAAKYGLKCAIAAIDDYPGEVSANILLDRIMGCDLILKADDGTDEGEQFDRLVPQLVAEYEAKGEKVYPIPMGGSNALGALGYYDCAVEVTKQAAALELGDARVVSAVGSIGTYMGLFCGLKNENSPLRLTGIAISPFGEGKEKRLMEYFGEMKTDYPLTFDAVRQDFHIETGYTRGAYNNPSAEVRQAIYRMARSEAIFLDPCYTGKAFAGLLDMIAEGKITRGEKVIFLHTGGFPGLYTRHHREEFEKELLDGVRIIK